MKNLFWALMASLMLIACDPIEDKKDNVNEDACEVCGEDPCVCEDETCPDCGKNPCECTTPNPEFTPLQPSEQKVKISDVGEELLAEVPAEEWERYSQFVEDLANSCYTSDDYNWGNVEDWFYEEVEGAFSEETKLIINGGKYTNEWVAEIVVLMSDHTGLFTCTEQGVTISDYDGTKAVFTLNGKTYEAEIKSSGKVAEVKYNLCNSHADKSAWDYYDPEKDEWVYVDDPIEYERVHNTYFTVGVPERIDITLTENGASLFSATMEFTPSFKSENLNLTTDALSVKTTVKVNGFEIVADRIAYDGAASEASFKTSVKKDGKSLISVSASAGLKMKVETETYDDGDWSYRYEYLVVEKAQTINVSMDILGQIQAKGSCSNALEAFDELEAMWDELSYYDDETGKQKNPNLNEANRHLDNFNAKLKVNVYYDGTDTKQAAVKFALAEEEEYSNRVYYELIPIIEFNDGSKYKIEEFFTEDAFSELVDSFYELCESYDEVFGFSMEVENQ